MTPSADFIRKHLADTLTEVELLLDAKRIHHGKVRDTFELNDERIIITTDRQSAFDRILAAVPFKGQVLTKISEFWFQATKDIIANHLISVPDPNVMVVKKATVFPVEVVVRGYLTGSTDTSVWHNYSSGVRDFCGVRLPEGMKKNQAFAEPIITPTTKEEGHDRSISATYIVKQGLVPEKTWEQIASAAIKLFHRAAKICRERGLILVDTKMEFGLSEKGELLVVDELFTPDSSRFWLKSTYEQKISKGEEPDNIDKEFLRLWFVENCDPYQDKVLPKAPEKLIVELAKRYIEALEMISGEAFNPALGEPTMLARIEKNLKKYLQS
jgi:phosphoribosylaminoimidazole-succinocarboxamide synthase